MLGGCQAGSKTTLLTEEQVLGQRLNERSAAIVVDPLKWHASQRRYVEVTGDDPGQTIDVTIHRGDVEGRVRIAWGQARESVLQINEDRVLLVGTIDRVNDAWTTYEPPPTWLAIERMSEPLNEAFDVVVHSIRNSERLVDRGTGNQTYMDEGDQWVRLATGLPESEATVRCRRVKRAMSLDLGRADVESATIDWFFESMGLVGEDASERVKVLGPLGWAKRRVVVLSD